MKESPSRSLVLTAETAAGKSTAVPLALMDAFPGKILVTEPRRLAAVAVASRHAQLLGEQIGQRAGYRLRYDTCVSPATKIHVMTDAILTRMIQSDPALEGVSVIVLDEFHERSLHTDLSLAFLKEIMMLRDDLYLVVMSATMDAGRVAQYLGEAEAAPCFHLEGRRFPVEIQYRPVPATAGTRLPLGGSDSGTVDWCAKVVLDELRVSPRAGMDFGSILVFLPGIGEIRQCQKLLEQGGAGEQAQILLLHSSISLEEQRLVLDADSGHAAKSTKRRIILSSSIAETSLTVPDVTVVVDCGLCRTSRFDSRTGMTRLVTEIESDFSAQQRTGRAGRLGPGRCIRLWSSTEHRLASPPPEIVRADLVPVVLECARWGVQELRGLEWLDCPSAGGWAAARSLLQEMGCLEETGTITDLGRRVLELGVHPRIGCVAVSGLKGAVELAARYGASDPAEQQRLLKDLHRRLASSKNPVQNGVAGGGQDAGLALLAGFPDRLAKSCGEGVYQFPSGRTASLFLRSASSSPQQRLSGNSFPAWIVAVEVDAGVSSGRIYRWEPLDENLAASWLENHAASQVELDVDDASGKVVKHQIKRYGKLELERRRLLPDSSDVAAALCGQVRRCGFESLPLSSQSQLLLLRARLWESLRKSASADDLAGAEDGLLSQGGSPQSRFSPESLLERLEDWLVPFLGGKNRLSQEVVYQGLHWFCDGATLDRELPLTITLPNGKRRKLTYEPIAGRVTPVLEVVIQEMFGCFATPQVAGIPVLLRLLSPARRPLQVTSDLAGFWQNTWPEICKEMKGRYPKHNWDYKIVK